MNHIIRNELSINSGTASLPGLTFNADKNTGIFNVAADTIGISVGGTEKFRFVTAGDFHATGDGVFFSTTPSDARLKTNIQLITEKVCDKLEQLQPVTYNWIEQMERGGTDFGLIAQEVEAIFPTLIKEKIILGQGDDKFKTIDYQQLTVLLLKGMIEIIQKLNESK